MVETSPMKMRSESICEIFESAPRVKLSQALPIPKQLEQGPIPQSVEGQGFSNSGTALAAVAVSRIALASSAAEITRFIVARSEERRGGKECVSQCRSWWSPSH